MKSFRTGALLGLAGIFLTVAAGWCQKDSTKKIRIGYFPNLTHAQPLIGISQRQFSKSLGPEIEIETKVFNAGPSAVEALFAGAIDLTYIGPGPAVNAYIKSKGQFLIIAGAATGGAALVARKDAGIKSIADFQGKRIATPQLGNTQDIAARGWLKQQGFVSKEKGGTVSILPVANPDQLTLFLKKDVDAAWTVEPWVSRLLFEANGEVFMNESEIWKKITGGSFATTVILVSKKFLEQNPGLIEKWLRAHFELTEWIRSHTTESKKVLNEEIKRLTGKSLPEKVLDRAWSNVEFTVDPVPKSIVHQSKWAFEQGFLGKTEPDLTQICGLAPLNQILKEKKQKPVK